MYGSTVHSMSSTDQHAYKPKPSYYPVLNIINFCFVQFKCAKAKIMYNCFRDHFHIKRKLLDFDFVESSI